MRIVAVDPGSTHSAYVLLDENEKGREIVCYGRWNNHALLDGLAPHNWSGGQPQHLAIETITSRGIMPSEAIRTAVWVGIFMHAFGKTEFSRKCTEVRREQYRGHFCGAGGNDAQVRQAMIDRYGGEYAIGAVKCKACKGRKLVGLGKKRAACEACNGSGWEIPPGPLHGISDDVWQALAVGIFWFDTNSARLETKAMVAP